MKEKYQSKDMEIKPKTIIKTKGFNISIGNRADQVALISVSTGDFVPFTSIKKGGRLAKIKRLFKSRLVDSERFFFEFMSKEEIGRMVNILS